LPIGFKRLPGSFYRNSTEKVARSLLGLVLVRVDGATVCGGVIVETEAYLPADDRACHSHRGVTARNQVMFKTGGHLYVYAIHAKFCMNVVTETKNRGSAVLIRAIQPLWGIKRMQRNRSAEIGQLTNGPGKLCQALDVDLELNGENLAGGDRVFIGRFPNRSLSDYKLVVTPRIGISQAADLPLRFFVDRNKFVSGRRRDHSGPANQQFEV